MWKGLLFVFSAIALISGCQSSQNFNATKIKSPKWVNIGENSDGDLSYVDTNSIFGDRKVKTAWSKLIYKKCGKKEEFCELIIKNEYDCVNQTTRFLSGNAFKFSVPVQTENNIGQWRKVQPGSIGAYEFNLVCFNELD